MPSWSERVSRTEYRVASQGPYEVPLRPFSLPGKVTLPNPRDTPLRLSMRSGWTRPASRVAIACHECGGNGRNRAALTGHKAAIPRRPSQRSFAEIQRRSGDQGKHDADGSRTRETFRAGMPRHRIQTSVAWKATAASAAFYQFHDVQKRLMAPGPLTVCGDDARPDSPSASSSSRTTKRPPSEPSCVPRNSSRTRRSKPSRPSPVSPAPSG